MLSILTPSSKIIIVLSFLWQGSMAPLISAAGDFGDHASYARSLQPRMPIYFTIQCHHIDFSEWMSLFTLCLTPLAVHIFAGVPEPIVLKDPKPQWRDRICHLNPTSIFWRYYAITVRRWCAKRWEPDDVAATNAVFWTGKKWNGSEKIMIK